MKITSAHLDSVKQLVVSATAKVASAKQASIDAADAARIASAELQAENAAFDIIAAAFVSDSDLEGARASLLPEAVQKIVGYETPAPTPVPTDAV